MLSTKLTSHFAAALVALVLAAVPYAAAHDIPDEVRVNAFIKPEGKHLNLLVRVPLKAMRDIDVPRRSSGFLDFTRVDSSLRDAATLWLSDEIELYENGARLGKPRVVDARVSLESDKSFATYELALENLSAPRLNNDTELYWNQGMLDVLLEYPIVSDRAEFSIRPQTERLGLRVSTVLRFLPPGGESRAFDLHGDPVLVYLDPTWLRAALTFVRRGFTHILDGTDHLLFLLCLVIPFRRFWPLAAIVTAFTVAHSITLISAALGYGPNALWFPPLIEVLIAVSILYMALENVFGSSLLRRWAVALGFGLVHGFGFSFGLQQQLQFAGSHLIASLLSFNVGVELGQLFVLLILVPALSVLMRNAKTEKAITILLSVVVGHTAWHWLLERWEVLRRFPLPAMDAASLAAMLRWLMALLVLAGLAWLATTAVKASMHRDADE